MVVLAHLYTCYNKQVSKRKMRQNVSSVLKSQFVLKMAINGQSLYHLTASAWTSKLNLITLLLSQTNSACCLISLQKASFVKFLVHVRLALCVISNIYNLKTSVESAGRADALSGAGAQGLMQLMPATAARFGVTNAFDPADNIAGGVRFLDFLMETFDGDPIMVLAGYNAGENSIPKHKGVPPYSETRDYVPKVLAAFSVARGLCLTPPELVSDGCVFRVSGIN